MAASSDDPDDFVRPVPPSLVQWFEDHVNELNRMAADADDQVNVEPDWPVVLLDVDDVVCVNEPFGAHDARDALLGKRVDSELVFEGLFDPRAVSILKDVHRRFGGRLRYVISSTWRLLFTRSQLREVLRRGGLAFVSERLESKRCWATPHIPTGTRFDEVMAWLRAHHRGEPFVVIDDEYSGAELTTTVGDGWQEMHGRVILCEEWSGLAPRHHPRLVWALQTAPLASTIANAGD